MAPSSDIKFIQYGWDRASLEEFLSEKLGHAGYGGIDIQKMTGSTKITLYVERPGVVIGRGGESIKELQEILEKRFKLEKPEIEVLELQNADLCAPIVAKRIASALERGISYRRIAHAFLRRVMAAGAKGVEIRISGKIAGERARSERFFQGYLSKTGEPAEKYVSKGQATAKLPPGIVGVKVRIMLPFPVEDLKKGAKKEGEGAQASS